MSSLTCSGYRIFHICKKANHAAFFTKQCRRRIQTQPRSAHLDKKLENIRNIGIIAHVDAGKTTTTERMLFYSGVTLRVGDVDAGNTVTDFLQLERERGITIQSAAITLNWPKIEYCPVGSDPKTINLIDTPGHQDFRFEVDRCLPVLDGAICIIDSVKGVEAHTERVWASAHQFKIPRIMYCNKLDREGASFKKSVLEIGSRLNAWPLVCQIPWWDKGEFVGVIDVIDGVGHRWKSEREKITFGPEALKENLKDSNKALIQEMQIARQRLVEALADMDETIMERFLTEEVQIPSLLLKQAIKRLIGTGDGRIVPVFAGSSARHIGVEALLDAVTDYLPSPTERPDVEVRVEDAKRSLGEVIQSQKGRDRNTGSVSSIFKVYDHPKEGILSFVRVYHGCLGRNASSFNTNLQLQERPMGLVQVSASKTEEVQELSVGQIGAIRGLKHARSGDTLMTTTNGKAIAGDLRNAKIRPPKIPPPVAFLQVDPFGNVAAKQLEVALENASREDPSLRWVRDAQTDQFTIQGMGKLHLDVTLFNIRQKQHIDAVFGKIQIDLKECLTGATQVQDVVFDRAVAGKAGRAVCSAAVELVEEHSAGSLRSSAVERDGNFFDIEIAMTEGLEAVVSDVQEAWQQLLNGAIAGLARGPRRASPMRNCYVRIVLDTSIGATEKASGGHYSGVARTAVQAALREALHKDQIGILEPIMLTHITCPEEVAGLVQHDLTAGAGGQVLKMTERSSTSASDNAIDMSRVYAPPDPYDSVSSLRGKKSTARTVEIVAKVPYMEMLDYDEHLRSKTAGHHAMTMSFDSWARVVGHREKEVSMS